VIASTVGTSILSNLENDNNSKKSRKLQDLLSRKPSWAAVDDDIQKELDRKSTLASSLFKEALNIVKLDPEKYSAELNSIINTLRTIQGNVVDELELFFYPTNTGASKFCAKIIYNYVKMDVDDFKKRTGLAKDTKIKAYEPITLRGFGSDPGFFNNGLIELVDKFARIIINKTKQDYKVIVNSTAGFKAETAYITIMAMLAGAWRIVYMHEGFKEVVQLLSLPLAIDERYMRDLRKIGKGAQKQAVESMGIDVDALKERGLVDLEDGFVKPREWITHLLKLTKSKP